MDLKNETKSISPALQKVWDDLVQKIENDPGIWSKPWFIDPVTKKMIRMIAGVTIRSGGIVTADPIMQVRTIARTG